MADNKPLPAASLHLVLALLDEDLHGYALMRKVEDLSDGRVKMGPGTLYGTLNRLLADGLIEETTSEGAAQEQERKRSYRLTESGKRVAEDELARLRHLVRRLDALRARPA